jgi:RNA polymerase sigma factor (sigma-70 family)
VRGDDHILSHVGDAQKVAMSLARAYGNPLDELLGPAFEALVRSARAFDPDRKTPFWAFARHRIRGQVMDIIEGRARSHRLMPIVQLSAQHWRQLADERGGDPLSDVDPIFWRTVWRVLTREDRKRRRLTHPKYSNRRSPSRRVVIRLFYLQDLSMEEIGAKLGIDESRVSQIHLQALRALREELSS